MYRIFLFYALSGFISLGYQVAWFRIFTDWFGSTTLTFALVVANFIGGLGLGALLSKRTGQWIEQRIGQTDRLRVYGAVEILVGLSALLTVIVGAIGFGSWEVFPYSLEQGTWEQSLAMQLTQIGMAAACVLIPCFFMGVTFPLLCNIFLNIPRAERLPSVFYAWNTLGACSGVLACQFVLLPIIGHGDLFWSMALLNIALGGFFLIAGGAPAGDAERPGGQLRAVDAKQTDDFHGVLLVCATLSGLLAGALEGDVFKLVAFVIQTTPGAAMTFVSFWAILGIFLASVTVHRAKWLTLTHIKVAFTLALIYYAIVGRPRSMDAIKGWVHENILPVTFPDPLPFLFTGATSFPSNLTQLLIFVGIIVLPTFYLISLLLPYACNRVQASRRHLGFAYGLNTVAFCLGLVGFTLIAPRVNIFYSTKLFLVLFFIGVVQLILLRKTRRYAVWQATVAVVIFILASVVVPSGFDRSYFHPRSPNAKYPISSVKSDGNVTTHVVNYTDRGFKNIFFGRLNMSGTNQRAQAYMRLLAHFPLLAQKDPKRALLICFGVGNTASAIATHATIDQIDIVDLNDKVFETAPEFDRWNSQVYKDPRVRLIHDDGRHFLGVTDGKYDLVTSEPPPPMAAGVYRLYSREYYQQILEQLTPTGMMSQWLPIYQMPPEAVALAIRTFTDVFPHTLMFTGWGNDFILVGSPSRIDLGIAEERFLESESVVRDLRRAGIPTPLALLGRVVDSDKGLRSRYAGKRLISDQHNDLEQLLLVAKPRTGLAFDPFGVIDELDLATLGNGPVLQETLTHFGLLRDRVPGFPFESLANAVVPDGQVVQLADADWVRIRRLHEAAQRAFSEGDQAQSSEFLRRALQIAPEQPEMLMPLAQIQIRNKNYAAASETLQQLVSLDPSSHNGHYLLGTTFMRTGRSERALSEFQAALAQKPNSILPLRNMAWILATHPEPGIRDPQQAVELAERTVELSSVRIPEVYDTLSVAYAANGQFTEAIEAIETALALIPDGAEQVEALLQQRLTGYRAGDPFIDRSLSATGA